MTLTLHENQGVVATAVRHPAADVYKAIIADLDTAVANLPVTQADYGRATKGAAQTLRSKVYLTRAYQSYCAGKQADFHAALADAKAVINSGHLLARAGVRRPVVRRARRRSGPRRLLRQHRATIRTTRNSSSPCSSRTISRMYDGSDQYDYLHLVYLSQYDNNGIWVGIARDLNNGRPFRRCNADAVRAAAVQQVGRDAGCERHSRHALRRNVPDGLDRHRRRRTRTVRNCPGPCTSGATINVGDTTAVFLPYTVTNAFRQSKAYVILTPCATDAVPQPTAATYCGDRNNANDGNFNWQRFPSLKKFQDNLRAELHGAGRRQGRSHLPSRRGVSDRRRSGCRSWQHGGSGVVHQRAAPARREPRITRTTTT